VSPAQRSIPDLADELLPRAVRLGRLLFQEGTGSSRVSRAQVSVLRIVRDEGPRRISELAEAEHVAQPTITKLVVRLEREGVVTRVADPDDGRAVLVGLTPAGREQLTEMSAAAARGLTRRLANLDPDERAALDAALPALSKLVDL
jgi:DNA-binding MarR family transcriptional regulator